MLHYCAGLQCCLDLEEGATQNEPSVEATLDAENGNDKRAIIELDEDDDDDDGTDVVENEKSTFVSNLTTRLRNVQQEQQQIDTTEEAPEIETVFTMDTSDDEKEKSDPAITA